MNINISEIEYSIRKYLEGYASIDCESMHQRSGQRGGLFRLPFENGGTIVVKVWSIRNLKERIKSIAYISNGRREWRMHRLVYQAGIAVPRSIDFYRLPSYKGSISEAMIVEDLGETANGLSWLKQLISEGDESKVLSFEDNLIDITARFIDLHIMDIDHQLNNFVVDARGRLMRVDLECARRHFFSPRSQKSYIRMIARFLTGHIHAVQPDVDRSVRFAERLYKNINLGHRVKTMINSDVSANLAYQLAHAGIDTKVSLPV